MKDALGRRVWDRSKYGPKEGDEAELSSTLNAIGKVEPQILHVPKVKETLKQREKSVDLESQVGVSKLISPITPKWQQGGFYCKLCDCLLKDSQLYLDHLNGKKHNRMLGMSMRVERVTVDRVSEKLKNLKADRERNKLNSQGLEELQQQDKDRKRRKSRGKEASANGNADVEDDPPDEQTLAMAAMGFPTSFKKQ